jgi:arylsulfatase A-like enzyme
VTDKGAQKDNTGWNVVLITIDTLRHDLGYMGYSRPISPNIDALAQRSVVYEKAYALASYTSKSLAPMLIGRYGGETHRGWMHFNRYPAEDKMLQEYAREAGVRTLSAQGHWYFDEKNGMGRGFDVLDMSAAPKVKQAEGDKTVNSAQLSDAAISLIKQVSVDQKFYLWVHYLDPHAEYVAHDAYAFGKNQRALYDGEIAFTDEHIGRLLTAIEQSPFASKTVIMLTSDHGEAFSEHDMVRHGFELWEELVRVPWIVHIPGVAPRRVDVRRSAIDLAPTVLDFLGVPTPAGTLRGRSLRSELLDPAIVPAARPIFIDMEAGPYNAERLAYINDDLKLITSNMKPIGLYDLKADPGERVNLTRGPRLGPIMEELQAFRSGLQWITVRPP